MKIITAKSGGFCFGVKNAVDLALRAAKENVGKQVFSLGKLIHNEIVIEKLAALGVKTVESPELIPPDSVAIIRSHGVGKSVIDKLNNKNVTVIDATCLFVKKIQNTANEFYKKGYQIVVLGEREHPEVIGINGWCENSAVIINEESEVEALEQFENLCIVAQTTLSVEKYGLLVKKIQKHRYKSLEIFDTICYTTYVRQAEAVKISTISDAVLVLGSKSSSNTAKLLEICRKHCGRCFLIDSIESLKQNAKTIKKACNTLGIVAGASTPEELIQEVSLLAGNDFITALKC